MRLCHLAAQKHRKGNDQPECGGQGPYDPEDPHAASPLRGLPTGDNTHKDQEKRGTLEHPHGEGDLHQPVEIHHHPAGKQYRSHTILLCPQPPHQQPCRTQHQRQERRKTQQTRLVHHLQDMVMQIEGLVEEGLHRGQQTLRSAQAVPRQR